tara:strand:+ start:296 stop:475 length:180 start_codon:yes stop_codon:yes gene_type:complete
MEVIMRQAGFVPKNHDSGVYWVRANAGSERKKEEEDSGISVAFWLFVWCLSVLIASWVN